MIDRRFALPRATFHALAALALAACSSDPVGPDADADSDADSDADTDADLDADDGDGDGDGDGDTDVEVLYDPRQVHASSELPGLRGWEIRRGIVHCHSPYSHDACDDEPFVDGVRNEACFDDLRRGACETLQDFLFLTDHSDSFADHEYPDVLLYAPGDRLIERGGGPVANRLVCADGREVIVAAGTESGTMPIGLEHHVGATPEERRAAYDDVSEAGVQALQEAGALAFVYHTEEWDVETLLALPLDGIEIYNLHRNTMDALGVIANLLIDMLDDPTQVPDVELGLITFFAESEADLTRWSRLVEERRTVGVLATDVHRNALPGTVTDGERLDSYRRMMHWFSNHLLVAAGQEVDDLVLKETIGAGRFYGSFDVLGVPAGFDFHAEAGGEVYEMGAVVPAGAAAELRLVLPTVLALDPAAPPPSLRGVILRAADGAWEVVAEGADDLAVPATTGVYRAEVRMVPEHLRPSLGRFPEDYLVERVWVYSNPIYVGVHETPGG